MNTSDLDIDALLKRLHLANARRTWRDLVTRAETEAWSCRDFFALLVAEEVAHRQQTRIQRVSSRCGFPFLKTIDDFNFTYQSTVKLSLLGSALSPDFVTDGRSLILHGKPGRGKTHIAVAIAYRAIQNGFDTLFVTAAELIEDLSVASRDGHLANALARYVAPHVLVVDEVGYLTYGPDAANVLYHVVTKRYHATRAMIFTSNKHPNDWGAVLHDDDLAAAIVDRVLERGRLLHLDGPSMRTKHLGPDASTLDDRQPSAALQAPQPQRGRSQGREAPRRHDEGSLDAQAERRLSGGEHSPLAVADRDDLADPAGRVAGSPQVVKVSGIHQSEFPEPTPATRSTPAITEPAMFTALPRARASPALLLLRRIGSEVGPPTAAVVARTPSWNSWTIASAPSPQLRRRSARATSRLPRHGLSLQAGWNSWCSWNPDRRIVARCRIPHDAVARHM